MQLQRLKLVNFRQHADTDIVLGPGITAIIGPNGAGKTTLLEAIAWAIYGAPAARGNRDFIRWNRAPARASVRVELDFALGHHAYRVVRGLYQAELFQDGGERPVANSQQEVSARLERLLGMTRQEFFNTYFTGQKELAVMAQMGPADRARFLSRVLGYERLQHAQQAARSRRSWLNGEKEGLERGLTDRATLDQEVATLRARLAAARDRVRDAEGAHAEAERRLGTEGPAWSRMVSLRESVMSLDGERRLAEQRVDEARRDFQRLDRELVEAMAAQAKLKEIGPQLAEVGQLRRELERLEREAQAADRRRDLTGQLREVTGQIERATARLGELADVAQRVERAEADLAAAHAQAQQAQADEERARSTWVRERQDAQTRLQGAREQYRDLNAHRQRIEEAGPEGTCPTCLRPLGAEYEAVVGTLSRQLEELELNGKYFRQRVEQLEPEPEDVRDALGRGERARARLEAAMQHAAQERERVRESQGLERERAELGQRRAALEREIAALPDRYDAERHEELRHALRGLEPMIVLSAELRVAADRAERLVAEAEAADRGLTERETYLRQLVAAIADAGFTEEAFAAARERYEAAERAVREAELDLTTLKGDVRAAEQLVEAAERRLADYADRAARLAELKDEIRLHEELDRALGDLRTELNAQLRPELSEIASGFIAELTDGRYHELELDEEYRILLMEDGLPKPVISGGEEDVANLVLRLAISQLVAERAGQPLSLLVLDEVFASLDADRREHVVKLLEHVRDRFPQVILLTHVEEMRAGVDRVLRVTFDANRGLTEVIEDQPGSLADVAA
jgi:exonuclease SbcC